MKTCMVCGTEFPAHKNARALCSRKCKTAYETKQYKERLEQYSEKISPIMILYIIDMNLRAGMSLSAIAKLLNKSQTVIETRLEEARQSGLYERAVTQLKATYKDWPYVYQGKDRRVAKG